MEQSVSLDFETRSMVDIDLGAWRYAEDPTTEILWLAYAFPGAQPVLWHPGEPFPESLVRWITDGKPLRAWNIEFELAIYTRILRRLVPELPALKPSQLYDTQAEALAMSLPAKLDECGTALRVAEEHLKDPEGKRLIQYLCKPFRGKLREDPVRLERLGEYCAQDVVAERAIAGKLRRLDDSELELFRYNLRMNAKGLPIDRERAEVMRQRWQVLKIEAATECRKLTGGINPTQRDKILTFVNEHGCELPNLQKKTVERALKTAPELPRNVLELRQVAASTSLAKLEKLPQIVCADGTLKGLFKYHAASTGRWASQGGFNAQNLPRGIFEELEEYLEALSDLGSARAEVLVSLLRTIFAFDMTVVDYSQIETRMLLWLADDPGLDEIRQGLDPYKTMAARQYRVGYGQVTKPQRQIGKAAVLGAGYQLGAAGFIGYCDNMDIELTHAEAGSIIGTFREKYHRVASTWKQCQTAAVRAIRKPHTVYQAAKSQFVCRNNYLWIILPSGRRICYRKPWLTPGQEEWMGPQINFWGRDRYTRKWSKQETYGGSLFQSITQGSARDVMAEAMVTMFRRGLDVRGTVHDEIICKGSVLEQMSEIMLQNPTWCPDLPLAVDGWGHDFYHK